MKKNDCSRQYPIYIDLTHTPIEVWKSSGHLQMMKYRTINTQNQGGRGRKIQR